MSGIICPCFLPSNDKAIYMYIYMYKDILCTVNNNELTNLSITHHLTTPQRSARREVYCQNLSTLVYWCIYSNSYSYPTTTALREKSTRPSGQFMYSRRRTYMSNAYISFKRCIHGDDQNGLWKVWWYRFSPIRVFHLFNEVLCNMYDSLHVCVFFTVDSNVELIMSSIHSLSLIIKVHKSLYLLGYSSNMSLYINKFPPNEISWKYAI